MFQAYMPPNGSVRRMVPGCCRRRCSPPLPVRAKWADVSRRSRSRDRSVLGELVKIHLIPAFPVLCSVFRSRMRFRYIDLESPPLECGSVQGSDDRLGGLVWYFHKAKAAALVGLLVESDAGADDFAERLDEFGQVGGSDGKG